VLNHSANTSTSDGPIYSIWEIIEVIHDEEVQEFINPPTDTRFGLKTLMNISKKIGVSLTIRQKTYPRLFSLHF
tara:strand:+ start:754 stop:975 length:222 start_codon:yes stop_codon:yes gene_type:complete